MTWPKRMEFTYGQLDKVLRSLGFTCTEGMERVPVKKYELKEAHSEISVPIYPDSEYMMYHHFAAARFNLDWNGVVEPEKFIELLKKAAKPRRRRPKKRA